MSPSYIDHAMRMFSIWFPSGRAEDSTEVRQMLVILTYALEGPWCDR